jgi:polysaccharide export outer membrane protein
LIRIAALLVAAFASAPPGAPAAPPPSQPSEATARHEAPAPREADAAPAGASELAVADIEVLGPHDLLEISVFDVEQFSRTVRVAEDGTITLPFLGKIVVAGLTRVALEQKLQALLGEKYVQDPQVSVFVKEFNSRKVSVSGAVKNPATIELLGRKTLLDVVSEAGGFTEDVGRTVYVIRRQAGGGTERLAIDLEQLIYHGDAALNVAIMPGDVIYAPIEEKIVVYVNGAVKTPGGYEFKHSDQITVMRAITKAGGTTERAARKIQILRLNPDGSQSIIPVDLHKVRDGKVPDPVLQREDVVDVPEAFF